MYNKKSVISGLVVLMSLAIGFQSQASFCIADAKSNSVKQKITNTPQKSSEVKKEKGNTKDNSVITRAEISKMLDDIFGYQVKAEKKFLDVKNSDWYKDIALKVDAAGILKRDAKGNFNGDKPVTRQEAALILYRAFYYTKDSTQKTVKLTDSKEIGKVYKTAVEYMLQHGYMTTRSGNKFAPKEFISSDEVINILHSMSGEIKSAAGTYTDNVPGNLTVNAPDVKLKDITIQGDLYIAQGVGEGDVILDGVTVKGRVIVLGGGENSIKLQDTIVMKELVSAKGNGKVRIEANGSTSLAATNIEAGTTLYNASSSSKAFGEIAVKKVPNKHSVRFEGNFGNVKIEAPKTDMTFTKGILQKLELSETAKDATIALKEGTTVEVLIVRSSSTITGKGAILSASIEAQGVNISQEPGVVKLGNNITVIIGGISRNSSNIGGTNDSTVSNGENPGGGGNSGGSNPGGGNTGGENPGGNDNGGTTPTVENHTVKIIEFEYVRYLVIQFAEGTLKDYTVTVDGEAVLFTPVTTDKSIVKYELADRKEHVVKIIKDAKIQEYSVK